MPTCNQIFQKGEHGTLYLTQLTNAMIVRRFQSASGASSASKNPSIEAIAILSYQFKEAVRAIVETFSQ